MSIKAMDRFVNWINYWLVPVNATERERNHRLFEVGMSIGILLVGSVAILIIIVKAVI